MDGADSAPTVCAPGAYTPLCVLRFTGYHVALVVSGFTTKEHLKGRKHGAKRLSLCSRLSCCRVAPSLLEPRKLVPLRTTGRREFSPPITSHAML